MSRARFPSVAAKDTPVDASPETILLFGLLAAYHRTSQAELLARLVCAEVERVGLARLAPPPRETGNQP